MGPIKKLLFSFFLAALVCSITSFFVDKGLKKHLLHLNDKFTILFADSTYYDLLFVGSSRTHSNINPAVTDSITGLVSYNAGLDGAKLYELKTIFYGYLQTHAAPKYMVLNLDLFSFDNRRKLFNYSYYLPYYKNNTIDSVLFENKHYSLLYRYLPFFWLTEWDDYSKSNALRGYMGVTDLAGKHDFKGYIALENKLDTSLIRLPENSMELDTASAGYLQEIITKCKNMGIKLIFTYAPEYRSMWQNKVENADQVFHLIKETAVSNNIPFYRYDSLDICNDASLFQDVLHLNKKGSDIFSAIVAKDILTE